MILSHSRAFGFVVLLIFLYAGCGGSETRSDTDATSPSPPTDLTAGLPEQKPDTLLVEGMPEPVTLRLFHDEGLPALTYFPEGDFEPEIVTSALGTAIHFVATFGGVRNENAALRLFFPFRQGPLNDPAQLETLFTEPDGLADIEGYSLDPTNGGSACPRPHRSWAFLADDGRTGYACISDREGQWFLAIAVFPPEYSDGFGPRALPILREIQPVGPAADASEERD